MSLFPKPTELGSSTAPNSLSALTLRPDASQAAHAVAHVYYETNAHATGSHFIADWLAAQAGVTAIDGHLTWHQVLHELALGHEQAAIALYERTLDPVASKSQSSLPDTASFLWRWQVYGIGEGAPDWAPVVALASRLTAKPGKAFFDAHAALAYVGAGEWAAMTRLLDGLRSLAAGGNVLVAEVVLPLVEGVAAFGHNAGAKEAKTQEYVTLWLLSLETGQTRPLTAGLARDTGIGLWVAVEGLGGLPHEIPEVYRHCRRSPTPTAAEPRHS